MPAHRHPTLTVLALGALLALAGRVHAQPVIIPFNSGPIPPCDTSIFTANVTGVGLLAPWGSGWGTWFIVGLNINITTDHPEFLQISLTSPEGTTLLLSAFNGAGGQNYTNTTFVGGNPSITTGTAPFTGWFAPQGGDFSVFDWEQGGGTWTITVVDTACAGGPNPGTGNPDGSGWNPGWFDGTSAGGGFTIAFDGPPPCWGSIPFGASTICPGEVVNLVDYYEQGGTGYQFTYTMPDGWTPVPDPTAVSTTGEYYINAFSPWDNCLYFATYTVSAVPATDLGPDITLYSCDATTPQNLTALFTLQGWEQPVWSFNGAFITTATAAAAVNPGTYQLIAYNGGTCGDTALVTLITGVGPDLGPDQAINLCEGDAADLTALFTTTGLNISWTFNGQPIAPPTAATAAGDYELLATDPSSCSDEALVTVSVSMPPDLGADQVASICDNASFDLTATFGFPGQLGAWTWNSAPVPDATAVNAAGDYQLIYTDVFGCTDTAVVNLGLLPSPVLGADAQGSICANGVADLTTAFTTVGLASTWTLAGAPVADPMAVASAGIYSLVVTDAVLCSDTALFTLVVLPNPVLGPDQQVTACDNETVDLTTLFATGGTVVDWTMGGAQVADPASVTSAGSYMITATNPAGCSSTATATVQFNAAPSLGADADASICAGDSLDLTALFQLAGLTTDWSVGGAAIADPTMVDAPGNYQVVATNGSSCTDTALVSFSVNPNPQLGPDQDFMLCPWQTVDLSAAFPVTGMSASYTLNGVSVADPTVVADSGAFLVVVNDPFGCTDSAFAMIDTMFCVCEADFTFEGRCIQELARFTLLADSLIVDAQWDFSGYASASTEIDPEVIMGAEGEVIVTLIASLTCGVDTVQRSFMVYDCTDSCSIWIPNAFSPNSDDENDAWAWVGECDPEEFKVMVFNRWGELIYQTEDPDLKWDGTYNGVVSQDGVYVYRAFYKLPYQEERSVIGHVTLLR